MNNLILYYNMFTVLFACIVVFITWFIINGNQQHILEPQPVYPVSEERELTLEEKLRILEQQKADELRENEREKNKEIDRIRQYYMELAYDIEKDYAQKRSHLIQDELNNQRRNQYNEFE